MIVGVNGVINFHNPDFKDIKIIQLVIQHQKHQISLYLQQYLIDWQFCVGVAGVELPMLLTLPLLWLLPLMMLPFPFPIGPPPFWVTIIPPPLLTIPTTPPILFPILLTIVLPPEFIDRDIPGSHTHTQVRTHSSSLHATTLS